MAKKTSPVQGPVVTSLPLPASDSALVIDLPDGQKLLVGKMPNGSVIEVATWRGTGRPDSRTNRLMLGMSNSDSQLEQDAQEETSDSVSKSLSMSYLIYLVKNLFVFANNAFVSIINLAKNKSHSRKSKSKSPTDVEKSAEEWLEQIKAKASSTQVTKTQPQARIRSSKTTKTAGTKKKSQSSGSKRSKSPQKKTR